MIITSDDLYSFGQWARHSPDNLGYKSPSALLVNSAEPQSRSVPMYPGIDDAKADAIDKALCKLRDHDRVAARIFFQHYVLGYGYRALARRHDCGRGKITEQLNYASAFVIGAVAGL